MLSGFGERWWSEVWNAVRLACCVSPVSKRRRVYGTVLVWVRLSGSKPTRMGREGSGSVRRRVPLGKRARVCEFGSKAVCIRRAGVSSKSPAMRVGCVDVSSAVSAAAIVGSVKGFDVGLIHV